MKSNRQKLIIQVKKRMANGAIEVTYIRHYSTDLWDDGVTTYSCGTGSLEQAHEFDTSEYELIANLAHLLMNGGFSLNDGSYIGFEIIPLRPIKERKLQCSFEKLLARRTKSLPFLHSSSKQDQVAKRGSSRKRAS